MIQSIPFRMMLVVAASLCEPIATISPKPYTYATEPRTYFLSGSKFSCEIADSGEDCLG